MTGEQRDWKLWRVNYGVTDIIFLLKKWSGFLDRRKTFFRITIDLDKS